MDRQTREKNKRVLMYTRFLNIKTRHPLTREGQLDLARSLPRIRARAIDGNWDRSMRFNARRLPVRAGA
jgi:hypothetical protein